MQKRKSNLYQPGQSAPYNVSRSKIALFLECPRCFYLDRRLGISRPDMPAFSLNNTVDALLKREFDALREKKEPHRLMLFHRIEAVPYWHERLYLWRDDQGLKTGACVLDPATNFNVCGIIDDVWQNTKTQELHIVDYKATSTEYPVSLDGKYKEGYKRQMEVYQWIFRKLGFPVSSIGYFLFVNATRARDGFFGRLEFESVILPYEGKTEWLESTLVNMKHALESECLPDSGSTCEYCAWRELVAKETGKAQASLI